MSALVRLKVFLILAFIAFAAGTLVAAPNLISYQGRVTSDGAPIADGTYPAVFSFYSDAAAGTLLWTESGNVTTTSGLFTHELGSIVPIPDSLFVRESEVWFQLNVSGQNQSPRTRVTSTAYALAVNTVDGSTGGTITGELQILHRLTAGGNGTGGEVYVLGDSTTPVVSLTSLFDGGGMAFRDQQANVIGTILPGSNHSMNLRLGGVTPNKNVWLDGSLLAAEPGLFLEGSNPIILSAGSSGDAAVQVPLQAINSLEMSNEPGVASQYYTNTLTMDGSIQSLAAKSIVAPSTGYALVIGTAQVNISHSNGTQSVATFGISQLGAEFPTSQNMTVSLSSAIPSGLYNFPITVHGLFPIGNGTQPFYFLGDENSGAYTIYDRSISVIFLPTTYGGVTAPSPFPTGVSLPESLDARDMQMSALKADNERIQAELEEMKVRMTEFSRSLEGRQTQTTR